MLDVILLNYNDYSTTKELINKIKDYNSINQVLVVDNCSNDDSYGKLKSIESEKIVVIKTNKNGGYGYGNNYGMKYSELHNKPDYYAICNPDITFTNETLKKLIDFLDENKDFGIVAPIVKNEGIIASKAAAWGIPTPMEYALSFGTIISHLSSPDNNSNKHKDNDIYKQVDIVPGSFLVIRAEAMEKCDYYDENQFLFAEELVLGIKMRNINYKTALLLNEYYLHKHSVSINKSFNKINKRKLLNRSKYYVLSHYLNPKWYELLMAKTCGFISLVEAILWEAIAVPITKLFNNNKY